MLLELPRDLHYPITIRKISKRPGEEVQVRDALFRYSYVTKVKRGDRYTDEETEVDKIIAADFESPVEGKIEKWLVWTDDVIRHPREIIDITEPCKHAVQFNGLCTECGKDMTGIEVPAGAGSERANIQAAHDTDKLLISQEEASEVDERSKRQLLKARKLSLVVDLDQTIIHAAVDPTIGEWQKDPDNPNYEALKDVRSFKLSDDGPGMQACNYYIKLRPGLEQFLNNIAEMYELHIYTMGTRQYAKQIAALVDPNREYFGERILSRDESGSMVAKNLTRLFPVDTRMVVIIDDRGDVWKWSPNLIRVSAFDFFVGIGDINAGFLPKKQDIPPPAPTSEIKPATNGNAENREHTTNGETAEEADTPTDTTALQQVVAMNDPTMQEVQTKAQEETITSQLEQKPLLKLQQQLDERDRAETTAPTEPSVPQNTDSDSSDDSDSSNPAKTKARHSILKDDDEELIHLEKSLRLVHDRFFTEYDKKRKTTSPKTGRVAQLSGRNKAPLADTTTEPDTLTYVPDIKRIMPAMKVRILDGVNIVFSGVLPLGTDIQTADVSIWARSFGATITEKVTRDVTHVVAARVGTQKVKTAVKKGIKVVGIDWLTKSIQRWKKLDERPFLLPGIGQKFLEHDNGNEDMNETRVPSSDIGAQDLLEENKLNLGPDFLLSSEDEAEALTETDEDKERQQPRRKKPKLDLQPHGADNTYPVPEGFDDAEGARSPVSDINKDEWDAIGDELKDFLGSDMDSESDAESVRSEKSVSLRSKKRRRDDDTDVGDIGQGGDERNGHRANKLQKGTGGSALRAVSNVESTGENTPKVPREQTQEEYEADLAAELERELEAAEAAENGDD